VKIIKFLKVKFYFIKYLYFIEEPIQAVTEEQLNQINMDNNENKNNSQDIFSNNKALLTEVENKKINNYNNNETEKSNDNNIKEEEKKESELDRNEYLRNKLNSMNISNFVKKGVINGLLNSNLSIEKNFLKKKNGLEIAEKRRNVNNFLNNKNFLTEENISKKLPIETKYQLKTLKKNAEELKKAISKIDINKKFLENSAELSGLNLSNKSNVNMKKFELKQLNLKRNDLANKLDNCYISIDRLITEQNNFTTKKERLEKFINNFDNDKKNASNIIQKIENDSKIFQKKMENEKKVSYEKQLKKIEELEKEKENNRQKIIDKNRDIERNNILKRKKKIEKELEKTKKYINVKFEKCKKDYFYGIIEEKYENEEKKLFDKINRTHKDSLVTREELKEHNKNLNENEKLIENEKKIKSKQLHAMWGNRSSILPKYKNPIVQKIEEENKEKNQLKENQINNNLKYQNEKKKLIESIEIPKISIDLKRQRENRKDKIDKDDIKETRENIKKLKDKYYLKNSPKFNTSLKKKNKDEQIRLIKNKYYQNSPHFKLHPKPEKPIDYLPEISKNLKSKNTKKNELDIDNIDNNGNVIEKIELMKLKTDKIDDEVKQKRLYIKVNGGYSNNPEETDEMGDLMIESLKAKVKMFNKLSGN